MGEVIASTVQATGVNCAGLGFMLGGKGMFLASV